MYRGCFQGGGAGGYFVWVGDVGVEPPHGTGSGKFLAQGRHEDYGEAAKATGRWGIGGTTVGESNGGGGV